MSDIHQQTLFNGREQQTKDLDNPKARKTDPWTSKEAAARLDNLNKAQQEVLDLFKEHGPMIDQEMVNRAVNQGVSQSRSGLRTRRKELVRKDVLRDSGDTRETRSGNPAIVWEMRDDVSDIV